MAKPVLVSKRQRTEASGRDQQNLDSPPRMATPVPQSAPPVPVLSDSERNLQISLCAYFRAERRGFAPGHMWDDWLAAEQEVAARNARGVSNERGENKA